MKFTKLPITIEEQIKKLKSRGLKFDNEAFAQNYLSNISYYRLRANTVLTIICKLVLGLLTK